MGSSAGGLPQASPGDERDAFERNPGALRGHRLGALPAARARWRAQAGPPRRACAGRWSAHRSPWPSSLQSVISAAHAGAHTETVVCDGDGAAWRHREGGSSVTVVLPSAESSALRPRSDSATSHRAASVCRRDLPNERPPCPAGCARHSPGVCLTPGATVSRRRWRLCASPDAARTVPADLPDGGGSRGRGRHRPPLARCLAVSPTRAPTVRIAPVSAKTVRTPYLRQSARSGVDSPVRQASSGRHALAGASRDHRSGLHRGLATAPSCRSRGSGTETRPRWSRDRLSRSPIVSHAPCRSAWCICRDAARWPLPESRRGDDREASRRCRRASASVPLVGRC